MELTQFTQWGSGIIQVFGYPGLFFVNFLSTSTVFFPVPGYLLIFIFGGILNPWLVTLFSALGAAIGEGVAYGVGRGGGYFLRKKREKYFLKGKEWFKKGKGFLIIFLFAATPLPFDVIGILSGTLNYEIKKFFLAAFLGKLVASSVLAFGGFYGISWILNIFKFGF